jgi:hypothetical protein
VEQNDVFIRAIALFVHEQDVAGGACVELVLDPEVEAECALHGGIPAGNGQAEWRRQVVDDVLEGVMVGDRGEEVWATREPGDRLAISNVDAGDAVLLEEFEDLGGRFLGDRAGESTRQHAYPDRGECGVVCPILDGLDGCDVVVVEAVVVAVLRVVLVLVLVLFQVLLVVVLVKPRERTTNQVDGRELNASRVEELNDLGTRMSVPQNCCTSRRPRTLLRILSHRPSLPSW